VATKPVARSESTRRNISEKTREAMALLKAQGVKFGTPENLDYEARLKGARNATRVRIAKAIDEMWEPTMLASMYRAEGCSLEDIASAFNARGMRTRRGSTWSKRQVKRLLDRVRDVAQFQAQLEERQREEGKRQVPENN